MPLRPAVSPSCSNRTLPDLLGRAEHELLAGELVGERLELGDALGEPRGDLAHPVGVDLDPGRLHLGEHAGQRQLDLAVERGEAALLEPLQQRPDQPARRLRPPHERGRLLVGLGLRHELDPVLGGEVVELVLGAAGIDQVRGEQRVVARVDPQRLRVVHDQLRFAH